MRGWGMGRFLSRKCDNHRGGFGVELLLEEDGEVGVGYVAEEDGHVVSITSDVLWKLQLFDQRSRFIGTVQGIMQKWQPF